MKSILDLTCDEAQSFFLKQENYCNINLPPYFSFQSLLNALSIEIKKNDIYKQCKEARKHEDVNYTFYTNKDGLFAWRPLQLINPALYICLILKITESSAWSLILERFREFRENKNIICCSIPIVEEDKKKSTKKGTILHWWEEIEQRSLEYALDFSCFLNTDITDCYGSIYTHTISWALHEKEVAKEHRNEDSYIGNIIDSIIQCMSYAQTNGIPQGSVLMDFIAECVLGYADLELTRRIKKDCNEIIEYKILRYRDDYRIFAKRQEDAVKIAKLLAVVLQELNFKINAQKTFVSTNIIRDAIKPDKYYWNESKQKEKSLQKHLLLIYSLSQKYPNSGSLSKALDKFYDRVYPLALFKEGNMTVLVSILVDIAYKNPRVYPITCAILGKLLSLEINKDIKAHIYNSIKEKYSRIPNIGHLQVWLQRLTLKENPTEDYNELLCKKVNGENIDIWNIKWLNKNISNIFATQSIIDSQKINYMPSIPEPKEIKIFDY